MRRPYRTHLEAFAESSTRGRKMIGCRSRIALELGPSKMRWGEQQHPDTTKVTVPHKRRLWQDSAICNLQQAKI